MTNGFAVLREPEYRISPKGARLKKKAQRKEDLERHMNRADYSLEQFMEDLLTRKLTANDATQWLHCASIGEGISRKQAGEQVKAKLANNPQLVELAAPKVLTALSMADLLPR